jgi:chemotaxis protein CheX
VPDPATLIVQLVAATEQVFRTMVCTELEQASPIEGDALRPGANVVGIVGFTGTVSGLVALYSTLDGATQIAASMLDTPPGQVNGEMADAIGELTNMIAGMFRLRMAEQGESVAISIPSVTVGSDFYTRFATDVRRVLCPFRMRDGREICVELILTRNRPCQ